MSIEEEFVRQFGVSINKPELIQQVEQITKVFSLSVEDVYINWESFVVTKHDGVKLEYSVENLNHLQQYIQDRLEKKRTNVPSTIKARKIVNFGNGASSPFTPLVKRKKLDPSSRELVSPSKHISPTKDLPAVDSPLKDTPSKTPSNTIIESLNEQLPVIKFTELENNIKIIANFEPKKYTFRTMRQKLLEAADVLDDQIDTMANVVQEQCGFQFANPSIISQDEVTTMGRIVPDNAQYHEGDALNAESLALECSRMGGIGKRIPLDLSILDKYSLFPGQIVCLKGKNPSGEVFKVHEVVDLPSLGSPVSSSEEMGDDVKLTVVSGPYTSLDSLDFTPLEELVSDINNEYMPHVVIMFGPFIDITHPVIANGLNIEIEVDGRKVKPNTLDDVFKLIVTPILRKINPLTQLILIPSLRDSTIKHAAYPQDSFDRKLLQLGKNIKSFPNPSVFQINEINVGVSHNDIFKDLKDVFKNSIDNRFERLSNHVIEQRRFYPLFPGVSKHAKKDVLPGSQLDVPYLGLTEFNIIPDILIIPSELRFFAKVVKNVLVINPGSFMKFNSKGSLANISIKKSNLSELSKVDGSLYLHDVWKRARVDITKT